MSAFVDQEQKAAPVYIMSPVQRCGTNHLADVLLLHSEFQLPKVLDEDFVFEHANLLYEYSEKMYQRWRHLKWIDNPGECRRLLQIHLGQGILSLLDSQIDGNKRLLLKTPDSNNLDKFFLFFPEVKLLLLIRDGRDVVESAIRKWANQSDEYWIRRWAKGSRQILDFMSGMGYESRGKSWELVRYEELVQHPEVTTKGLLGFLGIDEFSYKWDKLTCLPVHGSSAILDDQGRVSWEVVEKPKDFSPLGRWRHWSMWRKRKFKKIAGAELIELGYESDNQW